MEILRGLHSRSSRTSRECSASDLTASGSEKPPLSKRFSETVMKKRSMSDMRPIPPLLKGRVTSTVDGPTLAAKFRDLFSVNSKELLLKSYRCSLQINGNHSVGKLYVSSSYLCFVKRPRKSLETVIRLSEISSFETREQEDVWITANDKIFRLFDFQRHDSAVGFLSNYLKLPHEEHRQSLISTYSKSTLASSSTTSQQSFSVASPDDGDSDQALGSFDSQCSQVSAPDLSVSTQSRQPMHSTQLQSPPIASSSPSSDAVESVSSSSSLQSSLDSHASLQDEKLRQSQRPPPPPPPPPSTLSTIEKTCALGLTVLSDVAYQVSCLPLYLLGRIVIGSMSTSFRLSPRGVVSSRSFTIFIAYVVLTFLAISMAYLYYRIETFPMDASLLLSSTARRSGNHLSTSATAICGPEFKEVASTLARLSELSDRMEQLTKSIKSMSAAGSALGAQEGRA